MRKEHAMRAVVLHATPMGDSCLSACEGTATAVLVCRTVSPFRPSRLDLRLYGHIRAPSQLRRALVKPSLCFDLANSASLSDPTHSPGMVNCAMMAMMYGLAISLPESTLVQSPLRAECLRPHAYPHSNARKL